MKLFSSLLVVVQPLLITLREWSTFQLWIKCPHFFVPKSVTRLDQFQLSSYYCCGLCHIIKSRNIGLYQISKDGPSVNIKFYNEFIKKHREECHHQLIDMGSYSLHIIFGALPTGGDKVWMGLRTHPQRSLSNITWLTCKKGRLWVCDRFKDISFQFLLNSVNVWFM